MLISKALVKTSVNKWIMTEIVVEMQTSFTVLSPHLNQMAGTGSQSRKLYVLIWDFQETRWRLIASLHSSRTFWLSYLQAMVCGRLGLSHIQSSWKFIETTANGVIVTLSYLAIHQDEQEKAYMDVKGRLGMNGELVMTVPLWQLVWFD